MTELIVDLITLVLVITPMVISSAMVVALTFLAGARYWQWYHWLILAPVLYFAWLLIALWLWGFTCARLGRRHPKPSHAVFEPGKSSPDADPGLITALFCYSLFAVLKALPIAGALGHSATFGNLYLRAYAPSARVGKRARLWGYLYDPDLTTIGEGALVGGRASIVAHAQSPRLDGAMAFITAPITIGDRATIGGESRIPLGCVIGHDAVIEPGSILEPFTIVPANEFWGGHPARFLRHRDGAAPVETPAATAAADTTPVGPNIRRLVIEALNIPEGEQSGDFSQANCANWDSLGQIAIAAAIYSRYGAPVDAADVLRIRSLADVAQLAEGRKLASQGTIVPTQHEVPEAVTLPNDLDMLPLLDPAEATRALAARFEQTSGGKPIRVVMAASFTLHAIAAPLKLWGRAFGFQIEPVFAEYNQILQALLDREGPFYANPDGINLVLTRPEDLAAHASGGLLDSLLAALENFAAQPSGQLMVGTLPPLVSAFSAADSVGSIRARWQEVAEGLPGVELLDFSGVVERLGVANSRSNQSEILTRGPYSPQVYRDLAIELVRRIRSSRRSPSKVLALDCDNTLWGGVVGEVGLEGIELGSDGAGRGFQMFQRHIQRLKERGLLLVIVSKNEERDVRDVFERHPEMILRPSDIAAWRVNWMPKSENLRSLAAELNVGIDSFVFLDDDPFVRNEVQSSLPQVHVVPLPPDPAEYCETLSRLWLFDAAKVTDEDASRTRMIQEEGVRQRELNEAPSLEGFLASLQLRVDINHAGNEEWPRVAQLTQRTNQFNLSLKRRTVGEMRALGSDAAVLTLRASDRFGEYGLVGVCAIRPQAGYSEIDTLLMSCRVLGRGVEDAFLYAMGETGRLQGATKLVAPFVKGPRNAQVKDFLLRSGFTETSPHQWEISISEIRPLPPHVELHAPEIAAQAAQTSTI